MAEIVLPALNEFTRARVKLARNDTSISLMGGQDISITGRVVLWVVELDLVVMDPSEARLWKSRLMQLARFGNYFKLTPPDYSGPSNGYVGANPTVNGASQVGYTLTVAGPVSTTLALEGDYVSFGNDELRVLTADLVTNGAGAATMSFEPAIKVSPTHTSAVELQTPQAKFRFMDSSHEYDVAPPVLIQQNIRAVETISP